LCDSAEENDRYSWKFLRVYREYLH
jgi:hypothetical protein